MIKTLGISILMDISHFISLIMIPKAKELKLISIYLYICDIFDSRLKGTCQRFSNNSNPDFTDQEVMTIYLYAMNVEQRLKIKQIPQYANDYLPSWFPLLPSWLKTTRVGFSPAGSSKKQIFKEHQRCVLPGDCQFMSLEESRLLLFF